MMTCFWQAAWRHARDTAQILPPQPRAVRARHHEGQGQGDGEAAAHLTLRRQADARPSTR